MIGKTLLVIATAIFTYNSSTIPTWLGGPDYTFRQDLKVGQELSIANIDGSVTLKRSDSRTAEILVTKKVRRGNGNLVTALLENTDDGFRICTVYLSNPGEQRDSCSGNGHRQNNHNPLEVEMTYEVRVPDGVELNVATVDGDILGGGFNAVTSLATVDGNIDFEGAAPQSATTVDGDIRLRVTGEIPSAMKLKSVDGSITVSLPATASFTLKASTVDGEIESAFPLTMTGRWGSHSMRGQIGGGATKLDISTVDGSVKLLKH